MSADSDIVIGLFERIVSYYQAHGGEMNKEKAKRLKLEYEKLKLPQAIQCQKLKKLDQDKILEFITKFTEHYLNGKNFKEEAKVLAANLRTHKDHISIFLKSTTPFSHPEKPSPLNGRGYLYTGHSDRNVVDPEKERYKQECHRLQQELDKCKHYSEKESNRRVHDTGLLQQKLTEKERELREKDRQIQDLSHRGHDSDLLQHKVKENEIVLREKDRQIQDLSHRLSSEMNTKVSANETSLENISVKSRPMNISVEYQQLFSDQWTEAKNALDMAWEGVQEKGKLQYLCGIVLNAYKRCEDIKKNCNVYIREEKSDWYQAITSGKAAHTSVELKQAVFDYWKARGTKLEVPQHIVQQIIGEVTTKQKAPSGVTKLANVQTYVKAVFCLTWSMVIQKPPMSLDVSGIGEKWRGDKVQELAWGSKQLDQGTVQCYVYPTLKHGQQIMVRGKVLIL